MSLAPSVAVPRSRFNPLPLLCRPVLPDLELRLRRRQDRRHRLPAADPARRAFPAGRHYIWAYRRCRRERLDLRRRDVAVFARARHRQQRALSRPRLYRTANGLRRPRRPRRQRQSGIHRGARGAFPRRGHDLAQGVRAVARRRRRHLHRLASPVGRHRLTARASLFTLASLASIVAGTILFKLLAPKGSLWIGNGMQNLAGRHRADAVRARASPMSATSFRARGCSAPSPSSCSAARSSPTCSGFIS